VNMFKLDDIDIVPPKKDDVFEMRNMHGRVWRETYENEKKGITKEWLKERTEGWLTDDSLRVSNERFDRISGDPRHFERVAKVGNAIVGIVHGSKLDNVQHLEAIYVDTPYHGKGVAKRLMDELMSWFDVKNPVTLEVVEYNDRAQAFYRKYGFSTVEGSEHLFANKVPVIDMKKDGEEI